MYFDTPFSLSALRGLVNGTAAMTIFCLRLREIIEDLAVEDQVAFAPLKSTSPAVMAIDPRCDGQADDESGGSSSAL